MDIQRAAELLAARSAKDFGNALKDRDDPFKDFYKSLPICILDAVFSIGVRYTSVVNVVNSYIGTFDLTRRSIRSAISLRMLRSMIRLRTFPRMCFTTCSGLPAAAGF